MLSEKELCDWLLLLHTPGIGPRSYHKLLSRFGHPERILAAPRQQLVACGLGQNTVRQLNHPADKATIRRYLDWVRQTGNRIICFDDPDYPPLLREIPDPPPLLYITGDSDLLSRRQLAIVGSRNPSPAGRETTYDFSHSLASLGLVITSGLALGIDSSAHRGALDAGAPTIAVTGTGLDRIYPPGNRKLARMISTRGALVSELPIGTPPRPDNFPRRNRIISGLSLGTLVTEAALHSGSLITARLALEQNREVFAIPGAIHNPLSRGCHALLQQGAKLVTCLGDISEELPFAAVSTIQTDRPVPEKNNTLALDPIQQTVLNNIDGSPTTIDTLVERTGLTAERLSSILLVLELRKRIMPYPGGAFCRPLQRNSS